MPDWLDDGFLAEQYEDASNLAARQILPARFSTADPSRYEWLFDQFDRALETEVPADADVLSLGAGLGTLWARNEDRFPDSWDVTVTDAYQGMVMDAMETLDDVDREFHFNVVDARDVPYPDDSFDVVTTHFLLSHFDDADREAALREIRRVLRPDGTLYAATTGENHLAALFDAVAGFGSEPDWHGFSLANGGDQLREEFGTVDCRRFEDSLHVDAPEPLVAYVLTLPGFDPVDGRALEHAFRERMDGGELELAREFGVFVATDA